MQLSKITDTDLENKGVTNLPNIPGLEYKEMQKKFEEIVRDVVVPKFNNAMDLINATIYFNEDGDEYLTENNIITTADAISSVTDPKKVPAAIVVKDMVGTVAFDNKIINESIIQAFRVEDTVSSSKNYVGINATRIIPEECTFVEHGTLSIKRPSSSDGWDVGYYSEMLSYENVGKTDTHGYTVAKAVAPNTVKTRYSHTSWYDCSVSDYGYAVRAYVIYSLNNKRYICYSNVFIMNYGDGFGGNADLKSIVAEGFTAVKNALNGGDTATAVAALTATINKLS